MTFSTPLLRKQDTDAAIETERFLAYAHSLPIKKLAQISRASNGTLAALYATCLEQRMLLAWGRYANWLIHAKGLAEQVALRMANTQFGATPAARLEYALTGHLDDSIDSAEEQQLAKMREEARVEEAEQEAEAPYSQHP
jgi:hypothetical protein